MEELDLQERRHHCEVMSGRRTCLLGEAPRLIGIHEVRIERRRVDLRTGNDLLSVETTNVTPLNFPVRRPLKKSVHGLILRTVFAKMHFKCQCNDQFKSQINSGYSLKACKIYGVSKALVICVISTPTVYKGTIFIYKFV